LKSLTHYFISPVHLISSKVDQALSAEAKEELRKLLNPIRPEQPLTSAVEQIEDQLGLSVADQSIDELSSVSPSPGNG
jgi:hypothetical protein